MIQSKSERVFATLCIVLFCVSLSASAVFFIAGQKKVRRVFFFPSYDSRKLCTEVRYMPARPLQGVESSFVEEILLGPMTNRFQRIFPGDVGLRYCFLKDRVLYVGLDDAALAVTDGMSIRESIDVLRINIVKNFTYINKIDVSIDGKSVSY